MTTPNPSYDDRYNPFSPDESQNDEKRYLPRWKVSHRVKLFLEDDHELDECETVDLSCAGACVKLSQKLHLGQPLRLKIFLDENKSIDINGHVVWDQRSQDEPFAGIVFSDIPLQTQETILNHAFEIDRSSVIKHWFAGWEGS